MKKIYFWYLLILILIVFLPVRIFAQNTNRGATDPQREPTTHVTAQQAMDIGYAFMRTGSGSKSGGTQSAAVRKQAMQLVYTGRATDTLTRSMTDCYYVFALQPKGFVIVAADDRVEPILGYSYDNNFVVENMPEHIRSWMGGYEQQIQAVAKSNAQAEPTTQSKWVRLKSGQSLGTRNAVTVGPLITTQWDQGLYYNALCPEDANNITGHTPTGCVATAMAQIINYWGYPIHGRGTHGYNSFYGVLEVDFDSTTYDYTNMPTSLSANSSLDEVNAVAKLMYHCGVAVNMEYETEGSGAADVDVRAALVDQFRFSPRMGFADRELYRSTEWIAMLQNELDNGRPVFYGGVSDYNVGTLGHAFICDGYDNNNYFHFNFGWSGNGDGWYLTSSINPGVYDFKSEQAAIMGIEPDSLSNTLYSLLGQMQGGYTRYTVDSVLFFGNELYGNPYKTLTGFGSNVNVVAFHPTDTTQQLVLDCMSFSELLYNNNNTNSDDHQYIYIYDGTPQSYTTSEGYTDYMLPDSLMRYYDENVVNTNHSPVVSTKHGLTLVVKNRYRAVQDFHFHISYDDGCRIVTDITTFVDGSTINLHWQEHGVETQWQVEYGAKGYHHGEGTRLTVNDTSAILIDLIPFQEYDIYVRPLCGSASNNSWSDPVTVMALAPYWTDIVTSEPEEGYSVLEDGTVVVSTVEGLAWWAKQHMEWDGADIPNQPNLFIDADISLEGYLWKPVRYFSGSVNGFGHTIENMRIIEQVSRLYDEVGYATTFNCGFIENFHGDTLQNLCFYSPYVKSPREVSGTIVGAMNSAIMRNCCVIDGYIKGGKHSSIGLLGGVVAAQHITNCYAIGEIHAEETVVAAGGLIGETAGCNVSNCWTSISTLTDAIISWNNHNLIVGYKKGREGEISNCFSDISFVFPIDPVEDYGVLLTMFLNYYGGNSPDNVTGFLSNDSCAILATPVIVDTAISDLVQALNAYVQEINSDEYRTWVWDDSLELPKFGDYYQVRCPNIDSLSVKLIERDGNPALAVSWTSDSALYWQVKVILSDTIDGPALYKITDSQTDTITGLTLGHLYNISVRSWCDSNLCGGWGEGMNILFDKVYWTDIVTEQPSGYTIDANGNVTITTAEGLSWLSSVVNGLNGMPANDFSGKKIWLEADIDLGGYRWLPITHSIMDDEFYHPFKGCFYGNGHTISNMYCNETSNLYGYVGLFGDVEGSIIDGVSIMNANITGEINAGIVVAKATNSIIGNCNVQGIVHSQHNVGGVVGLFSYDDLYYTPTILPEISNCSFRGTLMGCQMVGGLVGQVGQTSDANAIVSIANVYVQCEIYPYDNGNDGDKTWIGGLIGVGTTMLKNGYSKATIHYDLKSFLGILMPDINWSGNVLGESEGDGVVIHNFYYENDPLLPFSYTIPEIIDISAFTMSDSIIQLETPVAIGDNTYMNMLDALNAWIDTYDTVGKFLHWVVDTNGIDGNLPIFENLRNYTVTLAVADSTPYGTVNRSYDTYATIISAVPDYGCHFVQWNDGNTDNPRTLYLTQDTTFVAIFGKNLYCVTATSGTGVNYSFNFEDESFDWQWTVLNGDYMMNHWELGTFDEMNRALFLSRNYHHHHDNILPCVFAYTTVHLSSEEYRCNYAWMNNFGWLALRVALVPDSIELHVSEWSDYELPNYAISLCFSGLFGGYEWENYDNIFQIREDGDYKIVIQYYNKYGGTPNDAHIAVDNIRLYNDQSEEDCGYILGSDTVPYLDTVMLTAVPYEGYSFIQWQDGIMDNPRSVVANKNQVFRAIFSKCPRTDIIVYMPVNGYNYNGQTYTEEGVYTFNYPVGQGCDSVVNLILCNESRSICDNHFPYICGDTTFAIGTLTGLYPVTTDGQKSYIYLKVNPTYSVYDTIITCDNYWEHVGDVWLHDSLSGDYQVVLQSSCGCDSVVYLHYVSNPSYKFDIYDTIPRGAEYNANGFIVSADQTLISRHEDQGSWYLTSKGCDSAYTLHLTCTGAGPIYYVTQNGTGDGSSWGNALGDLQMALDLAGGVQGDVWVAEGTYYGDAVSENAFSIPEGVYVYGGFVGNEPMDYDLSLRDFDAHPTILDGQHVQRTVCQNSSWREIPSILDGFTIQNGFHTSCGGNVYGYPKLVVNNCVIQEGNVPWPGNGGGIAFSTICNSLIINNTGGWSSALFHCDAFNCVMVDNNGVYTSAQSSLTNCIVWGNIGDFEYGQTVSYTAMDGQFIEGGGNIPLAHSNDGTSPDSNYVRFVDPENGDFRLAYGSACINAGTPDISGLGLPTVDLQGLPRVLDGRIDMGAYEYYPVPEFHTYDTVCEGNSVVLRGTEYAVDGSYTIHANPDPTQDTVYVLHLTVNQGTHNVLDTTVCESFTWVDGTGATYTVSDTYTHTYTNENGCASVDTLHLTVNTPTAGDTTATVCGSFSWCEYSNLTQSGNYTHTLTNAAGCDSTITLHLTINTPTAGDTTAIVCGSFSWYEYSDLIQSGDYTHTLTNAAGCDSTVTLHLTINTPTAGDTTATVCGSFDWYEYTGLTQTGTYTHTLTNAAGCDSTVTLHLTVNTPTAGDTTATVCGSFDWYEYSGLTQSGDYTYTLTNAAGCDSTVTLHLTVNTPTASDTTATVCGSFSWYEYSDLTQSGDYAHTLTNAAGCDSTVTLHLTVNTPTAGDTTAIVCGSFSWYEYSDLTQSGDYIHTLTNATGCDSVVTLHLTVNSVYEVTDAHTICASELPYTWNNVQFTEAGTKITTLPTVNGCDSVVTMTLILNPVYNVTEERIVCAAALPYTWNEVVFTEAGTNITTLQSVNNCDSVVTMILSVNTTYNVTDTKSICFDELPYTWNGVTFTEAGTQSVTLTAANDCDSVVTMTLTVNHSNSGDTTAVVCESFDWYGMHFTQSGEYSHTLTNAAGCDSIVTLHLTINTPTAGDTTATVCGSFNWYEYSDLTQSGDYIHTFTNAAGCDSTVTLHLTVNTPSEGDTTAVVCGSFSWYEYSDLAQSGDYTHTLTNAAGCDSIVTLHLTVNTPTAGDTTATVCGSFSWYEYSGLTQSGDYTHTLTNAAGCDSTVTLHLTVNTPTAGDTTASVCGSFSWYEYSDLTLTGNYTHTLTNAAGCDSTVTLYLTVNTPTSGDTTVIVCGSFDWYEYSGLTQSGDYTHTLNNAAGCDSTVTLHLTVNTPTAGDTTATVCGSFSWYEYSDLTQSGNYTHTLTNAAGCDSTVTLHLTVNTPTSGDTTVIVCGSFDWYEYSGLTQSGDYTHTLNNAAGCDSTVTLHLTVNTPTAGDTTAIVCGSFSWYEYSGLTQSGDYTHTLTNAAGCDSTVTLHLTINTPTVGDTTATVCGSFSWYEYSYLTQSGDYTHMLTNTAGCDSTVTLHLTVNTPTAGDTTATVCGSFDWYEYSDLTQTGTYTHTLTNATGCDSTVTLHLTVNTPTAGDTTVTVCGSFDWYEYSDLTQSGDYTHTLTNAVGCDSTVTLHLTINTPTAGDTTATVCGSFNWYEYSDLTQSGNYTHTLTNSAGCDSTVTLHLTVNTPTAGDTTASVCDSFSWYEYSDLTQTGNYTHTLTNAAGCDSTVTLHLIVNTPTEGDTTATVCGGFSWYEYSGLTQSGNYTHTLTNAAGCDSTVTLHLTVNTPTSGDTTATVCGSFSWYEYSGLTQSGDYTHTLNNAAGCDSTVTLHLTVNTPTAGDTTATVCGSFSWYEYSGLTQSGNYTHTLTNAAGCDSTVTLHLTVNTPTSGDTTATVCGSFSWYEYSGLTQSGDYTHTFTNAVGCDSVVTLHLTVNQPTTGIDVQTACGSYTWIDGITYSESNNTATYMLANAVGCDSVVTLNLTINQSVTSISSATICDSELPYVWNGLTFNEAGTQSLTLQTVNGCDSVIDMTLTVNQSVSTDEYLVIYDNELPYHYVNGEIDTIFEIGTPSLSVFSFQFSTQDGCDSVVTLHLTIETGIDSYAMNASMKVYPNPTSNIVNVELSMKGEQTENVAIQVFDVYGKLLDIVETQNFASLQTTQIDLSRYSNGVYFIKAVSEGNVLAVRKVVRNR